MKPWVSAEYSSGTVPVSPVFDRFTTLSVPDSNATQTASDETEPLTVTAQPTTYLSLVSSLRLTGRVPDMDVVERSSVLLSWTPRWHLLRLAERHAECSNTYARPVSADHVAGMLPVSPFFDSFTLVSLTKLENCGGRVPVKLGWLSIARELHRARTRCASDTLRGARACGESYVSAVSALYAAGSEPVSPGPVLKALFDSVNSLPHSAQMYHGVTAPAHLPVALCTGIGA